MSTDNQTIDLELDDSLLFRNYQYLNSSMHQGQYSSEIASLAQQSFTSIVHPQDTDRPPIKDLTRMAERDPVVSQCLSFKALRATQSLGDYKHNKKEIEDFIQGNLKTLPKNFKQTVFKLFASTILYGIGIAEFSNTNKARGHYGEWRLGNINVLDPEKIISFKKYKNKSGKVEFIEYDNGNGNIVEIPYKKCIHIINNAGAAFDMRQVWGVGCGIAAMPYHILKKNVLTNLDH